MTLELRAVTYSYAGTRRRAIEDIELTIADGEIVGLTGPNESGKTTTCLVASGFAPASIGGELTGEVLLDGERLAVNAPWELAGRTGLLLDVAHRTGMTGTVLEEIAFGPVNLGLEVEDTLARAHWAMGALGIDDLSGRAPANLSGGQQRLVAIAGILAMAPRILVLDEPLGELDTDARARLAAALRTFAAAGNSILIAEHDHEFLAAFPARIITIRNGRIDA
ncbi:MAG TPA: ABC transporter ATP-binding protein [Candidatus Limnocylindrales bacterium]|nr:ABC transporter ATP-binding protein [Candidatus Limnocylindrales bacterium]